MDRISLLPQPIQLHVLNFLEEKEIARAAVLSKTWRSTVHTRPVLVFGQRLFKPKLGPHEILSEHRDFVDYVDKSIQRLVGQDLSIQEFSLEVELFIAKNWSKNLDRWIQQLVQAKVKVLTLYFKSTGFQPHAYVLPPFMLLSETITNLRLGRCQLGHCNFMRLPNLLELTFEFASLSQDMIDQISSGCPNLEILRLILCRGLSSIFVSGLARLQEVKLRLSGPLDVKIVGPMLRVFNCEHSRKIDLLACESTLRSLTLSRLNMTTEGFRDLVSKLLALEKLALDSLRMESIEIKNHMLLRLEVYHCSRIQKRVGIDAPNLRVLRYKENNLPCGLLNSPNCMIEVYGCANPCPGIESYRDAFKDVFLNLSRFTNMKLIVRYHSEKEVIVCQVVDENVMKMIYDYFQTLGAMAVTTELVRSTLTHEHMVDYHLFGCRYSKTVSIISHDEQSNRNFLEVLRCWRHSSYSANMINEETTQNLNVFQSLISRGYQIARVKLDWTQH